MLQGESKAAYGRGASIGAWQATQGEFDLAIFEFPPEFDFRHIGGLWETAEEFARLLPGFEPGQRIGLAPPLAEHGLGRCGAGIPSRRHTAGEVGWARRFPVHGPMLTRQAAKEESAPPVWLDRAFHRVVQEGFSVGREACRCPCRLGHADDLADARAGRNAAGQ